MKQIILKLVLATLTCFYSLQFAYAGGGGTFMGNGGALETTQWLNNIELGAIASSDAITAAQQTIATNKEVILDPIVNALIAAVLQQATNNVINWANGGYGGNPLIISNPQIYVQNKGLGAVKMALGNIPQNNIYSGSVLNAVVGSIRGDDPASQLRAASQSAVPSLIQNNFCTENNLNQTAINDVKDVNGNYDQSAFATRKAELYNTLCTGNPNTNPQLSQTLMNVNNQRPQVGDWGPWLATTGGDNEFTNTVKGKIAADKIKTAVVTATQEDITRGGGYVSETKCVRYEINQEDGSQYCAEEGVLTPGASVQNTVSSAAASGLTRLTNIQGFGSFSPIFLGLLTNMLTNGINQALSNTNNQTKVNTAVTVNSASANKQDLLGNPAQKDSLTRPMIKEFTQYLNMLNNLENTDTSYLIDVNNYITKLNNTKACWDTIKTDPSYPAFLSFYNQRKGTADSLVNFLTTEKNNIVIARTLVNTTMTNINNSNSSQEIYQLYTNYTTQVEQKGLPTLTSDTQRALDYRKNTLNANNDNTLINYQNQCASITAPPAPAATF